MKRLGILLLALLLGCAVARITLPDGTRIEGWPVGTSRIEACAAGGSISSPGGAFVGPCGRIEGGEFSAVFGGIAAAAFTAAVAIVTHGALW